MDMPKKQERAFACVHTRWSAPYTLIWLLFLGLLTDRQRASLLHFWSTEGAFQYPSAAWFAVCLLRILAAASWSSTVVLRMSSGRFPVPVIRYTAASSPKIPSASSGDKANNSSGGTAASKSSCVSRSQSRNGSKF